MARKRAFTSIATGALEGVLRTMSVAAKPGPERALQEPPRPHPAAAALPFCTPTACDPIGGMSKACFEMDLTAKDLCERAEKV